jgi:cytosol alanyl aminopeptidase
MRLLSLAAMAAAALTLAACGDSEPVIEGPPEITPMGPLGPDVTPLAYRLDLKIIPSESRFGGQVQIDVDLAKPKKIIYFHARDLNVTAVTVKPESGRAIRATLEKASETGVARLTLDRAIDKGKATITVQYDDDLGDKPDTVWVAEEANLRYVATQFQPLGARKAFPSFDEPRFKTPFEVTLTVPENNVAVSNAAMVDETSLGGGLKRVRFAPTQPLPTYLVAFAVGPYDVVDFEAIPPNDVRKEPIPLRGLTVKGKGERIKYALTHTAPMIQYLETYFGVPYPYGKLDLIAPPNFAAGGMENAGLIVYAERGILLDETSSAAQQARFFNLHAHELAHQWFGDLVTPKWWDDIWLNESFATWMAAKTAAAVMPGRAYERANIRDAIRVMDVDSLDTARAIRQPIKSDDDIFNAFDGLTYQKGAAVLSMFEGFAGEDAFREGVRVHIKKFAHGVATAKDFLESLATGTQRPELVAAFESFLTQPGVPFLQTSIACDRSVGKGEFKQGAFSPAGVAAPKRNWKIPVCLRNMAKNEPQQCALISSQAAEVALIGVCPNPALQMNAGGRGYYRFDVGPQGWPALLAAAGNMTPGEQLSVLDSARAAFVAGGLDAKTYFDVLAKFALAEAPDVAGLTGDLYAELRDKLVAPQQMPAFETKLRAIYAPSKLAAALTAPPGETVLQAERRVAILKAMSQTARDPAVLAALKAKGEAVLKDGPAAVEPNLLPLALWALANANGVEGVKQIQAAVEASTDAEFRGRAIAAVAGARGADAVSRIGNWMLNDTLRTRERADLIRALYEDPDNRGPVWTWMRGSLQPLMNKMTASGRTNLIRVTGDFCDAVNRISVEETFKPRIGEMPGAPRVLANALERMNRCMSLKVTKGDEVAQALGAPAPRGQRRRGRR